MVRWRRGSPWIVLGTSLLAAAAIAAIVAVLTWSDPAIEGAYINRSVGRPVFDAVISQTGRTGGREWLGFAIGLAVAGALVLGVVAVETRRIRRRATPLAPAPPAPARGRGR
jgi:hypothetical protein